MKEAAPHQESPIKQEPIKIFEGYDSTSDFVEAVSVDHSDNPIIVANARLNYGDNVASVEARYLHDGGSLTEDYNRFCANPKMLAIIARDALGLVIEPVELGKPDMDEALVYEETIKKN